MRKIKLWLISIYNDVAYEFSLWWRDFTPGFKIFICALGILFLSTFFGVIISNISSSSDIHADSVKCDHVGFMVLADIKEATI